MGKYFAVTFANSGVNLLTLCLAVNPFSAWVAHQRAFWLTLYLNCCSRSEPERATVNSKEQPNTEGKQEVCSASGSVLNFYCDISSAAFVISSSDCWESGAHQSLETGNFSWQNVVFKVVNGTHDSLQYKVQLWIGNRSYFYLVLVLLTFNFVWFFFACFQQSIIFTKVG